MDWVMKSWHITVSCIAMLLWAALAHHDGNAVFARNTEGSELIGKPAPELTGITWLTAKPPVLKNLRGKVVLIRLWNRYCSMCENTAPLLNELHRKYCGKGLVVIGIHHKKTKAPDTIKEVADAARLWKMEFAIGLDNDWISVKKLWMHNDRSMTSASILIDKNGRYIWIHPGGTLAPGSKDAIELETKIQQELGSKSK
jgi:thiol-disulfide isomerase/thioredoxin